MTCAELDITKGLPELKDEINDTDERWRKLNEEAAQRERDCEEMLKKLADCSEKLKPIEEIVDKVKKLVKDPVTFGDNVEEGKQAKQHVKV